VYGGKEHYKLTDDAKTFTSNFDYRCFDFDLELI